MLGLTIQGKEIDVISGTMSLPRAGVWHADLVINSSTVPKGSVVARLSEVDMPAHVHRAEFVNGMIEMRIVGGNGGLGKPAKPKHYKAPLVRHVFADLVSGAGEQLSVSNTESVMSTGLSAWTTLGIPAGCVLQALAERAGAQVVWRVNFNGMVWMGAETWPQCPADVRIISQDGHNAAQVIGTDSQGVWPGTTIGGRRIDLVVHEVGATPRSTVYFAEAHQ